MATCGLFLLVQIVTASIRTIVNICVKFMDQIDQFVF